MPGGAFISQEDTFAPNGWSSSSSKSHPPALGSQGPGSQKQITDNVNVFKDNQGNVVIPAGQAFVETAPELESMGYLVEGVLGATS